MEKQKRIGDGDASDRAASTARPTELAERPSQVRTVLLWLSVASVLAFASCKWTNENNPHELVRLDQGWRKANMRWQEKSYPPLSTAIPEVPNAEYVREDAICHVCHKTHVDFFQDNVHRKLNCEDCHGPASEHLVTRGKEPGKIWNFKTMNRAVSSQRCAKCHEQDACAPGSTWRTSAHAHHGVACTNCHNGHYILPEGTAKIAVENNSLAAYVKNWRELVATLRAPNKTVADESDSHLIANQQATSESETNNAESRYAATSADDKQTLENLQLLRLSPPGETALQMLASLRLASDPESEQDLPSLRGTSNNLQAIVPVVCYQCHGDMYEFEAIAHPHQINGPNGFNCDTCHDSHGNVLKTSRKELCLTCHTGSPTADWHASTHDLVGVACTDCHDPHPDTGVHQPVNIRHSSIRRPSRLPMSVNDPLTCYKCHQDVQAKVGLPSHHPIIEGKMTCSSCHNPHGNNDGMLNEDTVNLTCYKCHADLQGPFAYQHPPVEEDCSICHNPHGTVTNDLLVQPPTFLCLRCHAGHRADPTEHFGIGTSDIDGNPGLRPVFYTNCTNCHKQVHGSDLPSQQRAGALLR